METLISFIVPRFMPQVTSVAPQISAHHSRPPLPPSHSSNSPVHIDHAPFQPTFMDKVNAL